MREYGYGCLKETYMRNIKRRIKARKSLVCGLVRDAINGDYDCSYGTGIPCEDCLVNKKRGIDPRQRG